MCELQGFNESHMGNLNFFCSFNKSNKETEFRRRDNKMSHRQLLILAKTDQSESIVNIYSQVWVLLYKNRKIENLQQITTKF